MNELAKVSSINVNETLYIKKYSIVVTDDYNFGIVLNKNSEGFWYVRLSSGIETMLPETRIVSVLHNDAIQDAIRLLILREFMKVRDADIMGAIKLSIDTGDNSTQARELPIKFKASLDYGRYEFTCNDLSDAVSKAISYKKEQEEANPKALPAY